MATLRDAARTSGSHVGECRSLWTACVGCAAPRRCAGCACAGFIARGRTVARKSHRFHRRNRREMQSDRTEGRRGEGQNEAHLRHGGRANNGRARLALKECLNHRDDRRRPTGKKGISEKQNLQFTRCTAAENAWQPCRRFTSLYSKRRTLIRCGLDQIR